MRETPACAGAAKEGPPPGDGTSFPGLSRREIVVLREKGTVKWFNSAKGYGFIQRQTGEDVFVHHSSIQMIGYRTLNNGADVEFEVKEGPKGLHAENVLPN
ncbi:MAG: cold shock domain-containing protein [Acidobacteria bacterium]|nr:cold shock domain-containing protein [Acidobacteriota bacterium]